MDAIHAAISSPDYSYDPLELDENIPGMKRINGFVRNGHRNTLANNDAVEFFGDSIVNFCAALVISDSLRTSDGELGLNFSEDELTACIEYMHTQLVSNNTLGRIFFAQEYNPSILNLPEVTRAEIDAWVAGGKLQTAPKALSDLLEAKAWKILTVRGFDTVLQLVHGMIEPLIPAGVTAFRGHLRSRKGAAGFYLRQTTGFREGAALKVNALQNQLFLGELEYCTDFLVEYLAPFKRFIKDAPPVAYDTDGCIVGHHRSHQLLGHCAFQYFTTIALDTCFPILRSATGGAACFLTTARGIISSDKTLKYLVQICGMDELAPNVEGRLPRAYAELFAFAIGQAILDDFGLVKQNLRALAGKLATIIWEILIIPWKGFGARHSFNDKCYPPTARHPIASQSNTTAGPSIPPWRISEASALKRKTRPSEDNDPKMRFTFRYPWKDRLLERST